MKALENEGLDKHVHNGERLLTLQAAPDFFIQQSYICLNTDNSPLGEDSELCTLILNPQWEGRKAGKLQSKPYCGT